MIALAAAGARTGRNVLALVSAVGGVYLLTDVRIEGEPLGVAFAFANAALFALYIVLAHRIAQSRQMSGIDGLGAAMLVAFVAIAPIRAWSAAPALLDPIARCRDRRRDLLLGHPLRLRPARDGQAESRHVLADGLAVAGNGDGRRHRRARPDPLDRGVGVGLVVAAVAIREGKMVS